MPRKRKPRQGKTAPRWRGPEGKEFAELVEDIRYADYDARGGKPLPWKLVLAELEKLGYRIHQDPEKLKADYHSAVKYWSALYGGRIDDGALEPGEPVFHPAEYWTEHRHSPSRKKQK